MGVPIPSAAEASVRQLIANGKPKIALERAKEIHKGNATAWSELLLVDAYGARIRSLLEHNLEMEAKSLIDLVCQRFSSARERLEELIVSMAVREGKLGDVVKPLSDPALSSERRAAIEQVIQSQVIDLAALADCGALDVEHPLRKAASALHRAFIAATSGPVAESELDLPEVSRRSPLAGWKPLIKAIGCFYRGEDARCREYLDSINKESVAARLIPAMQTMLGGTTAASLPAAASLLVNQAIGNLEGLKNALKRLDRAFAEGDKESALLKAGRAAIDECRQSAPALADRLTDHVAARCLIRGVKSKEVERALGEAALCRSNFALLYARGLEESDRPTDIGLACGIWDGFRNAAVNEGLFDANGVEVAVLYLHMAGLLTKLPPHTLREIQSLRYSRTAGPHPENYYFYFPDELFERGCKLDPQPEGFALWLEWTRRRSEKAGEHVAELWHRTRPTDLEPLLYLMTKTMQRGSFQSALKHLTAAERIDKVHPRVRQARAVVLVGSILRHVQQVKPRLAAPKLAELAELPQMRQGDRPALIAAIRYMTNAVRGDEAGAAAERAEMVRVLGSELTATAVIFGVASGCKRTALEKLKPVEKLDERERRELPSAVARVVGLGEYFQLKKLTLPWNWLVECRKQLARSGDCVDAEQLRALADAGLRADDRELAYHATRAGLERGGSTAAMFLLKRAQSLPNWMGKRRGVCIAAAAEMARAQRDMPLIDKAVELLHQFAPGAPPFTSDMAASVVSQEKAARSFPNSSNPGPSYDEFFESVLCDCPDCRRDRGEIVDEDEDEDDDDFEFGYDELDDEMDDELNEIFGDSLPSEMPPEVARMLIEEIGKAIQRGESQEQFMQRVFGTRGKSSKRKGKRK